VDLADYILPYMAAVFFIRAIRMGMEKFNLLEETAFCKKLNNLLAIKVSIVSFVYFLVFLVVKKNTTRNKITMECLTFLLKFNTQNQ